MQEEQLRWKVMQTESLLQTPVLEVTAQQEVSAAGPSGSYIALRCPDWVMVIPVLEDHFVLVRQWRHAAQGMTTEFPGGVRDRGEDPAETAARELLEETGFVAGSLTHLGSCNPNPALFSNTFHCYLARELRPTGQQHLDPDELLRYETREIREVLAAFGSPGFSHALMGTALAFYLRWRADKDYDQ